MWSAELGAGASRSAAVAQGIVAIGDTDGIVHAVDATNGDERWQFPAEGGGIPGTIAIAHDTVYFGTQEGETHALYAVDVTTGKERWSFAVTQRGDDARPSHRRWSASIPPVTMGPSTRSMPPPVAERWRFTTGDATGISPALVGSVLYFPSSDRNLYAVDVTSGDELWRFRH